MIKGDYNHREYYAQFVTENMKHRILINLGSPRLKALKNSSHLNEIPLKTWDTMYLPPLAVSMKDAGDSLTMSGKVCILKEAAKQVIEELNK